MSITIDRRIAMDLIQTKLELLDREIEEILLKWGYDNIDDFLEDGRSGKLEEAENDCIDLINLRDKRKEISNLLSKD